MAADRDGGDTEARPGHRETEGVKTVSTAEHGGETCRQGGGGMPRHRSWQSPQNLKRYGIRKPSQGEKEEVQSIRQY